MRTAGSELEPVAEDVDTSSTGDTVKESATAPDLAPVQTLTPRQKYDIAIQRLKAHGPLTGPQIFKAIRDYGITFITPDAELEAIAVEVRASTAPSRLQIVREIAKRAGMTHGACDVTLYKENVNVHIREDVEAFIERRMQHRAERKARLSHGRLRTTVPQSRVKDLIWQPDALPNEPERKGPQYEFLTAPEDIVLMEGGKGSGKTDLLIFHCIRPEKLNSALWHGVIFRREYKRLVECIDRATYWFGKLPQLHAHWQGSDSRFIFPSGAWLAFHNVEHLGDEKKYQGWQIVDLLIDQLEEFIEDQFDFLMLQNRAGDLKLKCSVRATANPLGVGHAWVKRRFINGLKPNVTHLIEKEIDGVVYARSYRRIHTTVLDNPLLRHDKKYIATLATDPNPIRRKAMFKGDWDVVLGQFFDQYMSEVHVIPFRPLPQHWRRAAGFDYGNVKVMEFLACDHMGNVYVTHEFRLEPNVERPNGYTAMDYAEKSATYMLDHDLGENLLVVGDVNLWTTTGRDVGSTKIPAFLIGAIWRTRFKAAGKKPPVLIPVSKKGNEEYRYRIACNEAVRSYLGYTITQEGELVSPPKLFFMDTCQSITQTLPALQADPNDTMDIMDKLDDHDYDAMKMPFMQVFAAPQKGQRETKTAEQKWADQTDTVDRTAETNPIQVVGIKDWRTDW